MNNFTDLRQLNLLCFYYLLGRLSAPEEIDLKERLKKDKAFQLWFDWFLLKWVRMDYMKKSLQVTNNRLKRDSVGELNLSNKLSN